MVYKHVNCREPHKLKKIKSKAWKEIVWVFLNISGYSGLLVYFFVGSYSACRQ